VTLTRVGSDWPTIQSRVNHFGSFVRQRKEFEYVYTVEPESGGHANLLVKPLPPQRVLEAAARNQGAGRLWIDPRPLTARAVGYVFKQAISEPEEYLLLNGGRLSHQTRGIFPTGGLTRALAEVRARRSAPLLTRYSGKPSQPEYSVTEDEIDQLLGGPPGPFQIGESPVEKLLDSLGETPLSR
jgi:hypothetical protein